MSEQPPVATAVLDPTLQAAEDVNAKRAMLAQLQEQQTVDAQFNQIVAPLQQEQQAVVDTQFNAQVAPTQQAVEHNVQSDFEKWEAELQASTGAVESAQPAVPAVAAPGQTEQLGIGKPQEVTSAAVEPAKAFAPAPAPEQPAPVNPSQPSPEVPPRQQPKIPGQSASAPEVSAPKAPEITTGESSSDQRSDDEEGTPAPPDDAAEPFDESKLTIGVVDVSEGVDSHKRDAAAERLDRETTQKGFPGFLKKIWKGNLAKDYLLLKYQREAKEQILAKGSENLYAAQGGDLADHARASKAIVDRFVGNFVTGDDELLAVGERKGSMGDIGRHENGEQSEGSKLEANLRQAIGEFAEGKKSLRELEEYKKIVLDSFGKMVNFEDAKKGLLFADNIMEVAVNAKAAFDHGLGIANVEERLARIKDMINIGRGDARIGVRTEGKQNRAEKIIDWMQTHKSTAWINETSAGVAVGIGIAAANVTAKSALGIISKIGLVGVPSAIIAGAREYNQIKKDRVNHMRSMAEGGVSVLRSGKRRESLDKTRYRTEAAGLLTETLGASIANVETGSAGLRGTVDLLTQIKARIEKSDKDGIDLISFSSKESVESERRDLLLKMAEARVAVKKALTTMSDEDLTRAGMVSPDGTPIRDVSTLLQGRTANVMAAIESKDGDIAQRDGTFRTLRRNRVIMMSLAGYGTGLVTGIVMQEAKAALSGSVQGVLESRGTSDSRTLLATIFHRDGDSIDASLKPGAVGENLANVNGHTAVKVPPGFNLQGENGSWFLADSSGNKIVDNVGFDADGKFNEATNQALASKNFVISSEPQTIAGADPDFKPEVTTTTVTTSPEDYIASHKDQFTAVSRQGWYNNDTAVPDHNENDIWWGGENNTGIDANGNYVFSVAHMTPDGSWSQGASVDAQQLLADGKMKIELSVNQDNISQTIQIDVDQNGNAVINKDSFAGQNLFKVEDGHATFEGGYAEAVQLGDIHDGVQDVHMLATVVGNNEVSQVQDTVAQAAPVPDTHTAMVNTLTKLDLVEGTPGIETEIPPIIPLTPRSGLERTERPPRSEEDAPTQPIPVQPVATDEPPVTPGTPPAVPVGATPAVPPLPDKQREPVDQSKPAQEADEEVIDAELVEDEPIAAQPKEDLEDIDGEVIDETVEDGPRQTAPGQSQPDRQTPASEPGGALPRTPGAEVEPYPRLGEKEVGRIVSVEQIFDEAGGNGAAGGAIGAAQPQLARPGAQLTSAETSSQLASGTGKVQALSNWVQAEPGRLQSRREVTDDQGNVSWVEADGSPVTRSVDRERSAIHRYMDRLSQRDPEYVAGVELIANEMGPMNSATRVALNIPAWNGATDLSKLLPQYVSQTDAQGNPLAPGTYEVNILVTRDTGTEPSNAMLSVRRFMDEFENVNGYRAPINAYEVEIDSQDHTVGYTRKLLDDIVASRSIARSEQSGPLYMETENDPTVSRVDRKMIYNAMNKLDQNPQLDAVSGTIDRASSRVVNNDMLFIRRRADDFLATLASQKQFRNPKVPEWDATWNRIPTHDSNTAITAEAYALIDGDEATDIDGGAAMGEKIAMVRGDGQAPNLEVIGRVATRSDAETFDIPNDETLARISGDNEQAFANFLQWQAERVKEVTPNTVAADQLTRRMMFWLGFKKDDYSLNNGGLEVSNWDNVRTTLAGYRSRHAGVSLT